MLATAGMRMLPVESQNSILGELRRRIPRLTNFYFAENHAAVITGKEEGLFAWISANYVLGRLRVDDQGQRAESVGIIDMGGGSTQIAFEVPEQGKVENADFVQFNLGATDSTHLQYRLYVTTHLGFGANVANSKYREMLMNQFDRQDQAIAGAQPSSVSTSIVYKNQSFQTHVSRLAPLSRVVESSLSALATTRSAINR